MESSVHRSHCFDILEGIPPQDYHLNSTFLPNTDFHIQLHSISSHIPTGRGNNLDQNGENTHHNETDQHVSDVKRARRMVSNRESARKSRMRKKKLIEELQQQVQHFIVLNHHLSEKVINLLESNHQMLQENSQLKERVSSIQLLMADMLISRRNDESSISDRNVNHLRGETSNRMNTPFSK